MSEIKKINYKDLKSRILGSLNSDKEREILLRRSTLDGYKFQTLGEIGKIFGVTRERIRQIEKSIFKRIGDSPNLKKCFLNMEKMIESNGGIMTFKNIAKEARATTDDKKTIINIILIAHSKIKEVSNINIKKSWCLKDVDLGVVTAVGLKAFEILTKFNRTMVPKELTDAVEKDFKDTPRSLIEASILASAKIDEDADGNLGSVKWGSVRPKNTRDRAYVVFKKIKKPLHYKRLTELISSGDFFNNKKVSVEAVHNELIRDPRFVLVGRGLYALKEWGYKPGVVADVIEEILKKEGGPLHKNVIIDRVLETRFVKKNTILLNLQEKPQFKRVRRAVYGLK